MPFQVCKIKVANSGVWHKTKLIADSETLILGVMQLFDSVQPQGLLKLFLGKVLLSKSLKSFCFLGFYPKPPPPRGLCGKVVWWDGNFSQSKYPHT